MSLPLAEIDWNSLLKQPDAVPIVMVFGIGGIIALTAIIAVQWRKAQQARREARLKEIMIERGFTADEIVSVISSGMPVNRGRAAVHHRERRTDSFVS